MSTPEVVRTWLSGLLEQPHPGLGERHIVLSLVARLARSDAVLPRGPPALRLRVNVVDGDRRPIEIDVAVLTLPVVAVEQDALSKTRCAPLLVDAFLQPDRRRARPLPSRRGQFVTFPNAWLAVEIDDLCDPLVDHDECFDVRGEV